MGFKKGALLVLGTALAVVWIPSLLKPKRPVVVGGFALPKWKKVEHVFREQIEKGLIRGGSFAVYHEGKPVVHLFGGYADEESLLPWTKETISAYFSTTKGIGAICLAILVDRGHLDYEQPVIKYWPEFGQNGKEKVTVKQLLSHQAGLVAFNEIVDLSTINEDPERVLELAASAKPLWKLGEGFGYHALSIGVYMDALIRKCDPQHRNISKFFDDEIRKPLGADFYIGAPRSEFYRVAKYTRMSLWEMLNGFFNEPNMLSIYVPMFTADETHPLIKSLHTFTEFKKDTFRPNNPYLAEVELASALGYGSAAGTAKIWGAIANDGKMDGNIIMTKDTVETLYEPVISGLDKVLGLDMTMGVGTIIRKSPEGNNQAGHPGAGGQMGYMDHKRKLGWGYVSNFQAFKMVPDTYTALINAMYDCLQ